ISGVNRVLGATLTVYIFSGIIVSGVIIVFASSIIGLFKVAPENLLNAVKALRIAGAAFMLSTFASALRTIPEATQRYDILTKYNFGLMIIRYTAMYLIAKLGGGIIGLTLLVLFSAVVDIVCYTFIARILIPGIQCYPNFEKKGIREVAGYGIFSFANSLIQKASMYVDQLILGMYYSTASVAHLTAPKELISKAQGLIGAAGQPLFPRFSSMKEGEAMQLLYMTSLWVLTVSSTVIFIPLAVVIPDFLAKWLTPDFAEHSSVFARYFSLGVAFNGGVTAYFALLKGTGRIRWLTNIILVITVTQGLLKSVLVFKLGLIGTSISTIAFSAVGISLCLYVGNRIFSGFPIRRLFIETAMLPIVVGVSVFFAGCYLINDFELTGWFGIALAYTLLFVMVLVIQFGINYLIFRNKSTGVHVIKSIYQSRHVVFRIPEK
ncbi:MAG: oligosaccharide flippase family protein, partial [Bacteroidota bacterium]